MESKKAKQENSKGSRTLKKREMKYEKGKQTVQIVPRNLLKPTLLYEEAERRLEELKRKEIELVGSLDKAPEGTIHILSDEKRTQFYLRSRASDKSGAYISKKEVSKIRAYVQKAYDESALKLLNCEINNLEKFLRKSENISEKIRQIYSTKPKDIKQHINPLDVSDEDYEKWWKQQPYQPKEISESVPFYETKRKERVRSKSEINIANALYDHGIPYKYECPLVLKTGFTIHPDFTILDVKNRKEIYWEHRGMMDDKEYAINTVSRLKMMMRNGIYVGKNLVITEETAQNPLGTDEIEIIIKEMMQNTVMT